MCQVLDFAMEFEMSIAHGTPLLLADDADNNMRYDDTTIRQYEHVKIHCKVLLNLFSDRSARVGGYIWHFDGDLASCRQGHQVVMDSKCNGESILGHPTTLRISMSRAFAAAVEHNRRGFVANEKSNVRN